MIELWNELTQNSVNNDDLAPDLIKITEALPMTSDVNNYIS